MKLPSKRDIDSLQAKERTQEIETGTKLAKAIDELRELSVTEKQHILNYRQTAIAEIKQELTSLAEDKSLIIREIEDAKKVRSALLIPLDAEWKKVNAFADSIKEREKTLQNKDNSLNTFNDGLKEKAKQLVFRERELLKKEQSTEQSAIDSLKFLDHAKRQLTDVQLKQQSFDETLNKTNQLFSQREIALSYQEKAVETKASELTDREIELNNRERLINDKYQTLERTYGRQRIKRPK